MPVAADKRGLWGRCPQTALPLGMQCNRFREATGGQGSALAPRTDAEERPKCTRILLAAAAGGPFAFLILLQLVPTSLRTVT